MDYQEKAKHLLVNSKKTGSIGVGTLPKSLALLLSLKEKENAQTLYIESILKQIGKVFYQSLTDTRTNNILIVPSVQLCGDLPDSDFDMTQWFLGRNQQAKQQPTIWLGLSGLIHAEHRMSQTLFPIKGKSHYTAIQDAKGMNNFFVDANGCYGISRYCLPKDAEILYKKEIVNNLNEKIEVVMGFKHNNNIVLLFHPNMINDEKSSFYKETSIKHGCEPFFRSLQMINNEA